MNVLRRFWNDECGAALSIELILISTIVVIGMIVGLATFRDAVVQELGDAAMGIGVLNQTYAMTTNIKGNVDNNYDRTAKWEFGHNDESDANCNPVSPPNCNPWVSVTVKVFDSVYRDNNDFCDNTRAGGEGQNAGDPQGNAPACINMNVTTMDEGND